MGDMVLTRACGNQEAFGRKWQGPFPVVEVMGDNVYMVDQNGNVQRIHVDDLKSPAPERPQVEEETPPEKPTAAPTATPGSSQAPHSEDTEPAPPEPHARPQEITDIIENESQAQETVEAAVNSARDEEYTEETVQTAEDARLVEEHETAIPQVVGSNATSVSAVPPKPTANEIVPEKGHGVGPN